MVDFFVDNLWNRLADNENLETSRKIVDAAMGQDENTSPFHVAWAAHAMLENNQEHLSWKQRLSCLIVIESVASLSEPITASPFFGILVHHSLSLVKRLFTSGESNSLSTAEQSCLLDLIESVTFNMLNDEVNAALNAIIISDESLSLASADAWMDQVQNQIEQCMTNNGDDNHVSPLIMAQSEEEQRELKRLLEKGPLETVSQSELTVPLAPVVPQFSRPLPPPLLPLSYDDTPQEDPEWMEYLQSELVWLTPTNLRLMLLPDEHDGDSATKVLELLTTKAFETPLSPDEQRQVLDFLDTTNSDKESAAMEVISECGLSPQNLARLVQHNPLVANECLLQILSVSPEPIKNEYLSALVGMDMSLQSMEVVNRLANSPEKILHPEYIQLYISNCIASCENIQDRHAQNRLVRLVCVFLQNLIRNQIVNVEDLYYEVQAFCVEFLRIREAAALFKLLKSME